MPAEWKANPSVFSGVFKFVSRELEHFVASATGSAIPESDVFSEEEDEEYDDDEHGIHEESSEQAGTQSPPKKRTKTGSHPPTSGPRCNQHDSSTLPKKNGLGHREEHVVPEDNSTAGLSPSPPPLPRALKRRRSISMPGSLFPRTPSLEPERSSNTEREQRVRFASKIPDSPHPHFSPRKSKPQSAIPSSPPSTPRHRKQFDPTVQAAVGRFQEDADPSILLPKVPSPHAVHQYSKVDKGKGIAIGATPIEECETSGILRVRGKEKELVTVREDLDRNERRLESTNEAETSFLDQIKQDRDRDKEKIRMLEGEIERLKKELMRRPASISEFPPPPPPPPPPKAMIALPTESANPSLFASARASLRHAPTPVENSINPLPASRRAAGMPTVGIPPDKMAAFLNEMKTVRLRKVSASEKRSTALGSDTSFASAPNMSIGEGVDSSSSSLIRRSFSSVNWLTDASWSSRNVADTGHHSMSEIETRRGEKRKRTVTGSQGELRVPFRHRPAVSSTESSFATASNTSSIPSTNDSLAGPLLSQPCPPIRPANSAGTLWPSSSVTDAPTPSLCSDNDGERDETSPDDQSPSTPPVTTGPSRDFFRFKGNGIPVEPGRSQRRNIDVTMADAVQPEQEASHREPQSSSKPTIFDKRPPTSPFPQKSPRRPRPPPRKTQTNQQTLPFHSTPHNASLSDDEDPLSLTFSSPERALRASKLRRTQSRQRDDVSSTSLPPTTSAAPSCTSSKAPTSSQSQSRPRQSPRHRSASESSRSSRRLTLDEELRNAFAAAPSRPEETHIYDGEEDGFHEDSVLVGVGTRSKRRGFLPGGGAGGAPVFRGVGYVEGALDDDELLEEEPRHPRRSVSRGIRQRGDDDDEYLPPSKRGVHR